MLLHDMSRVLAMECSVVCVLHVDVASLSCKYSSPGRTGRKTRLMLVNEVALGNVKVRGHLDIILYL